MTYLTPLTSLRFFAAGMVLVMHARSMFKFDFIDHHYIFNFAVSFFFILSGFILMHRYGSKGGFSFGPFIKARVSRLWPAHLFWTMAAIWLIPVGNGVGIRVGQGIFDWWPTLALNLSMLHSWSPFRAHSFSFNGVSWSISTEMMLYCFFPLLFPGIRKNWVWKILAALCMLVLMTWIGSFFPVKGGAQEIDSTSFTYAFPLARVFEFCLGMTAWVAWDRVRGQIKDGFVYRTGLETTGVALFVVGIAASKALSEQSGITAKVVAYISLVALLVTLSSGGGVLSKALSFKPLVYLGEISFSLYLSHQVIMRHIVSEQFVGSEIWAGLSGIPIFIVIVCLSIAASSLTFHLVEGPGRILLSKFLSSRTKAQRSPPLAAEG
ncbi:acyltransferase family protein [Pseudomonas sp. ESBL1]|uniref:acyltransferase family protein n=1 Tax=Pseudomonas sp. ESBL1 TaxID=3077324 RepID=UPI002FC58876